MVRTRRINARGPRKVVDLTGEIRFGWFGTRRALRRRGAATHGRQVFYRGLSAASLPVFRCALRTPRVWRSDNTDRNILVATSFRCTVFFGLLDVCVCVFRVVVGRFLFFVTAYFKRNDNQKRIFAYFRSLRLTARARLWTLYTHSVFTVNNSTARSLFVPNRFTHTFTGRTNLVFKTHRTCDVEYIK